MSTGKAAVIYHTVEGHTRDIAGHAAARLREAGLDVDLLTPPEAPSDLASYDGFVVGGSVHAGSHHRELATFIKKHRAALEARPSAFFSVSLTAVKDDEQHQAQAMAVVTRLFDETGWRPGMVALFGGALLFTKYGFFKRHLLKAIAKHEGGDTDTSRDYDYTDYDAVDAFTRDFAAQLKAAREPAGG